MTAYYCRLYQTVFLTAANIPDIVPLPNHINKASRIWHYNNQLNEYIILIPIKKDNQKVDIHMQCTIFTQSFFPRSISTLPHFIIIKSGDSRTSGHHIEFHTDPLH